jgi:hypothetical protein
MAEIQTKTAKSQDAEKAQEKKRRLEPAPEHVKALADETSPFAGLMGVSAMELPLESHAAFLGNPRFSHSVNNGQKAGLVTQLQQNYGNQYVQRLLESLNVQAKLTVSSPADQYEREADRVADAITRAPASSVQRQAEPEEEEEEEEPIQAKPEDYTRLQRQAARGREQKQESEKEVTKQEKSPEEEKKRLAEILKKVDGMISVARKAGYKYAADNLEYWRSKRGGTKKIPAAAFKNQEFIIKWLRGKPRKKFIIGAWRRLKSGKLVAGGKVSMYWIDSLMAPKENELFYALGGFTVRSDVIVKAKEFPKEWGGGYLVSFEKWICKASDDYNWDKLKYAMVPLYGKISDDDLRLLEKAGYGKSFKIESEPWIITDSKCLQKVAISL